MLIEVKVPQLSESVSEASLVAWHKRVGETVARDENLIDIETDKVVLETPAPAAGVIVEILKDDGATVTSDDLLARIDTEATATAAASAPAEAAKPGAAPAAPASAGAAGEPSPAARKILEEKGIPAASVDGTGRGGRVTKEDAVGAKAAPVAAKAAAAPVAPVVAAFVGDRPEERVPMTRLRARIAERLIQSKNENAILTTFNEVNMAPVMALRKQYGDKFEKAHGVRLGFMGFFVKAAVAALKRFPVLNASIDGNDIIYHGFIDIGVAVGSPRGLVVPILRNVEILTIAEIELKIAEFGEKAKGGRLSIEELTGGTFSISNGGVFGSMMSTPIINPPQSAILGIHATKDRPVAENGQVVIRPINYLALS